MIKKKSYYGYFQKEDFAYFSLFTLKIHDEKPYFFKGKFLAEN